MKKIGNKFYSKVDVLDAYSFIVESEEDMANDDVIRLCDDNDLFCDDDDLDFAQIDNLIDEYDLMALSKSIHKI